MAMDRLPELPRAMSRSERIGERHLERLAVVYVRQSSFQQMMDHRESTNLQYGLKNRAIAMGWPQGRVLVIDEDLGKSLEQRRRPRGIRKVGRGGRPRARGAHPGRRDVPACALLEGLASASGDLRAVRDPDL
jgi:hypothetical protein